MITGQQAVYDLDPAGKNFTCESLHIMSIELGTGGMQDAAYLISSAYAKQELLARSGREERLSWDVIFGDSPLFFM